MKVSLVPSSVSERTAIAHQFLTSFILNDQVAVDAGCLGFYGSAQEQAHIKHVFITHTHMDHIGSLPIFVENAYEAKRDCVTIHGSDAVLTCLRKDVFNDRVWPDFFALSNENAPFLKAQKLEAGKTIEICGLRVTPVPVNHVVPTFGFVVEDADASIVIVSDTGPTDAIWEAANAARNLKAVFLEATFPHSLTWLANVSKHLTPAMVATEVTKLKKRAAVVIVHIKARYQAEVIKELNDLRHPDIEIGQFARPYTF